MLRPSTRPDRVTSVDQQVRQRVALVERNKMSSGSRKPSCQAFRTEGSPLRPTSPTRTQETRVGRQPAGRLIGASTG